jgi:hypothetical protein
MGSKQNSPFTLDLQTFTCVTFFTKHKLCESKGHVLTLLLDIMFNLVGWLLSVSWCCGLQFMRFVRRGQASDLVVENHFIF